MHKNIKNRIEFAKVTPSCFLVMSPFQILCALEAIAEFDIHDFKFVYVMNSEFIQRNEQMRLMAHQMQFQYDEYDMKEISYNDFIKSEGIFSAHKKGKYDRIFIGDYYATFLLMLSVLYASDSATLLYTDDGNSSISILQGKPRDNRPMGWKQQLTWYKNVYKVQQKERNEVQNRLCEAGVKCTNSFFTIYSDVKTKLFSIYPNHLCHLSDRITTKQAENQVVIIVGAALSAYAAQNRIEEIELEAITWKQLSNIRARHADMDIVYIPHGRDTNLNVPHFCDILHMSYQRIEEPIEYYLLKSGMQPKYIYGFNSTALLNLKRIFSAAQVSNWFIEKEYDNSYYKFFNEVRKYYEQNGIETEVIKYPQPTMSERVELLVNNVYGIFKLIARKLHMVK